MRNARARTYHCTLGTLHLDQSLRHAYPANVHDVAGVDTNVPGGCVIVLEPASFGPIPATIDRTKKPISWFLGYGIENKGEFG